MKFIFTLVVVMGIAASPAFAAVKVSKAKIEKAMREGIAKEMKFDVTQSKSSICGGEEEDSIFVTVKLKKMAMSEDGPKEVYEEVDHYAASVKEFNQEGFKAFMRDNQCME